MSDDERIERLTQLARRVWPYSDVVVMVGQDGAWVGQHGVEDGCPFASIPQHPRDLDALEAALLVLIEDGDREAALFSSGRRFEQAMRKLKENEP